MGNGGTPSRGERNNRVKHGGGLFPYDSQRGLRVTVVSLPGFNRQDIEKKKNESRVIERSATESCKQRARRSFATGASRVVTVTRRCVQLHKVHLDPTNLASVAASTRVRIKIKSPASLADLTS